MVQTKFVDLNEIPILYHVPMFCNMSPFLEDL